MREIIGDITDVTHGIIVHQTNCQDAIGAGVAQSLIEKWPSVRTEYHRFCAAVPKDERLGCVQAVNVAPGVVVVNSFSQFRYGNARRNRTVYTYEDKLLRNVQFVLDTNPDVPVYVPGYIGCGLAGGDWTRVRDALSRMAGNERLTVVYLRKPRT